MSITNKGYRWVVIIYTLFNNIEFVTMSTTGNAADFGDLEQFIGHGANGCCSNAIRGMVYGASAGSPTGSIKYN